MRRKIQIYQDKYIGENLPCFIIAEIGANHNQDIGNTYKLIDAAIESGADAVKFQSFTVENWISKTLKSYPTVKGDLFKVLKKCELSYDMYAKIMKYCKKNNIICFSTPSHIEDIKKLEEFNSILYKFGSVQITDIPTIKYAAKTKKPIILSAGGSNMQEVREAIESVQSVGNTKLIMLQCTSLYPSDIDKLNIRAMVTLRDKFNILVGFSDHTLGSIVPVVAARSLGATVVEKHITLSRKMKGPDHSFALEPVEFEEMVNSIRLTEKAMGLSKKYCLPEEKKIIEPGRRSIVANIDISKGTKLNSNMITYKRPGFGIKPKYYKRIIGSISNKFIAKDELIKWTDLKNTFL